MTAAPEHLFEVTAAFGVGESLDVRHLPNGLMNDNWAIATAHGRYALKRLRDVSADTARRNLRVLAVVAAAGVPACTPIAAGGESVVIIDGDAYCLLPWVHGTHVPGTDLTLIQATELGGAVGRLHQVINADGGPLPTPGRARSTPVTTEHAGRFAEAAGESWTPFGRQVIELLEQRHVLLTKHGQDQPLTDDPAGRTATCNTVIACGGSRLTAILDWDRIRIRPLAGK